MSKARAPGLILQTQNLDTHFKGVKGKINSTSKAAQKKGGVGLSNRKALQDISNSSSLRQETSTRKKNQTKEESNITEEMFLHDHKKCLEARKSEMDQYCFDAVLFEHGLPYPGTSTKSKQAEAGFASPSRYLELEPVPELPMPAVDDLCPSPIQWDSPPPSPSRYELPALELKSYIED